MKKKTMMELHRISCEEFNTKIKNMIYHSGR